MKTIRYTHIVLMIVLFLAACTATPTVQPTIMSTLDSETPAPVPDTSKIPIGPVVIVTTPLPASYWTPLPPTPIPGLPSLPEDVGNNSCPGTQPSMLMPGRQGRVSNATPDPNRVRAEPNAQAAILGEIPAGEIFDVLEGPHCADDGAWFKVRYEEIEGWMKEGSSTEYWVMSITTDARTVTGPIIEAGGFTLNLPEALGTTAQVQDVPYNTAENIPPVTLLRLPEYAYYDGNPSIYIYPVQDYLYYRSDLRPRLEGVRTAINRLLANPEAQVSLPEFRDPFDIDNTALLQAGRFSNGWGLHAVSVLTGESDSPYYVFLGFSADMQSLIYIRLPVRLAFGQFASNASPYDFSPTIDQVDTAVQFYPLAEPPSVTDPSAAGSCPGVLPFTLMLGDWARVSVDPPLPSRIRSNPGGDVLWEAQPGENLLVIDGPQCANGYSWWKVRSLTGLEGWAAEGDAQSYWLVEPISAWYQLPPPLAAGNLVRYDLIEISISARSTLVQDISAEFFPLATPMPTPMNMETPWPDDPRGGIFSTAYHAAHSLNIVVSNVLSNSWFWIYDLQDPLSRYYLNDQSYTDCTEQLRQNLQNDPPVAAYIDPFCGLGGGIPILFIADVQPVEFSGGRGVRFLIASGNNLTANTLSYRFEGLSDDGRYFITALIREIEHPYIVVPELIEGDRLGPILAWHAGQYEEAQASYDIFNERIETLLNAQVVTLYPQLSFLDEMVASIEIK